jgi:hypothetical protein
LTHAETHRGHKISKRRSRGWHPFRSRITCWSPILPGWAMLLPMARLRRYSPRNCCAQAQTSQTAFSETQTRVAQSTSFRQKPWSNNKIYNKVCFASCKALVGEAVSGNRFSGRIDETLPTSLENGGGSSDDFSVLNSSQSQDDIDWQRAVELNSSAGYDAYLSFHPDGSMASEAREKIDQIALQTSKAAMTSDQTVEPQYEVWWRPVSEESNAQCKIFIDSAAKLAGDYSQLLGPLIPESNPYSVTRTYKMRTLGDEFFDDVRNCTIELEEPAKYGGANRKLSVICQVLSVGNKRFLSVIEFLMRFQIVVMSV